MRENLTKTCGSVVAEPAVILAEIAQGKAVEVPAVGGVAERAEIGVMRGHDDGAAAGCEQAVELFHGADHVRDVFDQVYGANLNEGAVAKREWKVIEVGDDVGARVEIAIYSDRAGIFVYAAADVQD